MAASNTSRGARSYVHGGGSVCPYVEKRVPPVQFCADIQRHCAPPLYGSPSASIMRLHNNQTHWQGTHGRGVLRSRECLSPQPDMLSPILTAITSHLVARAPGA